MVNACAFSFVLFPRRRTIGSDESDVLMSLLIRSIAVWLLLLVAAIVNGTVRQALLILWIGEQAGHIASTVLLAIAIFGIGWLGTGWLDIASSKEAWFVGGVWLFLTLGFEFVGGHFLFGTPWSKLLADYDVTKGRIWILVLLVTTLTPPMVYRLNR